MTACRQMLEAGAWHVSDCSIYAIDWSSIQLALHSADVSPNASVGAPAATPQIYLREYVTLWIRATLSHHVVVKVYTP